MRETRRDNVIHWLFFSFFCPKRKRIKATQGILFLKEKEKKEKERELCTYIVKKKKKKKPIFNSVMSCLVSRVRK